MTDYTFDENILSDLHKDARGYRPSQGWMEMWSELSDESKQKVWNNLLEELREAVISARRHEDAAVIKFQERISDAIALGAKDEETAIRWILEGEEFELFDYQYGADYAAYHFDLPYRNKWSDTFARIAQQKVCELYEELAA